MENEKPQEPYTKFSNDLLEALCLADLTKLEYKIMLVVLRQTAGHHRDTHYITSTKIAEDANLDSGNVRRKIKPLIDNGYLIADGKKIGINKKVKEWGKIKNVLKQHAKKEELSVLKQHAKACQNNTGACQNNTQKRVKTTHIKERKKDIKKRKENRERKASAYAFAGHKIKLNKKDFDDTVKNYPNLDIIAELQQLDLELAESRSWWAPMHAKLNYRNRDAERRAGYAANNRTNSAARREQTRNQIQSWFDAEGASNESGATHEGVFAQVN